MPDLIANYLTIDPTTGAVGADFTGHLHAAGLDLDAAVSSAPATTVRWLDFAGVLVADIAGLLGGAGRNSMTLRAHSSADDQAGVRFVASTAIQEVYVNVGPVHPETRLLDATGLSAFLQVGHDAKSLAGQFTATFAGALNTRDEVITHNFNVVGVKGFAIGYFGGTLATFCHGEIIATAANTVTFRTRTIDGTIPAANATKFMDYLIWTP